MADVCVDNRFEIIAKVKEHLIKATNIEMHPEELAQVDNILFRLWQCGYLKKYKETKEENAELKDKYDTCLRENTGLKIHNAYVEKKLTEAKELIEDMYDKIPASHSDYYKDVMKRARQFISEVEK